MIDGEVSSSGERVKRRGTRWSSGSCGIILDVFDGIIYSRSRTGWVVVATLIKRLFGLIGRLSELLLPAKCQKSKRQVWVGTRAEHKCVVGMEGRFKVQINKFKFFRMQQNVQQNAKCKNN